MGWTDRTELIYAISIIDNTLYIVGIILGRPSGWYDEITQVPTLFGVVSLINHYKSSSLE